MRNWALAFTLILSLFFVIKCEGQAQTAVLNELLRALPNLADSLKIDTLLTTADAIQYSNPELAEQYYITAEQLAALNNMSIERGDICISMAAFYWYKGSYNLSFDCSRKALDIFIQEQDTLGMANSFMGMGIGYGEFGLLSLSTEYLLEALQLYEDIDHNHGQVSVFVNLADNYIVRRQYDLAKMYLEKAEKLADKKSPEQYIDILLNLAGLMSEVGDYRKARVLFDRVINLSDEYDYKPGLLWSMTEKADIAFQTGDPAAAQIHADSAYGLAKVMSDKKSLTKILTIMARIMSEKGLYNEAIGLSEEAMSLARKEGYNKEIVELAELRSELFENLGRHEDALKSLKEYAHLKDSIETLAKDDKVGTLALLYETEKRDSEIDKLKQDQLALELSARTNRLIIVIFLIVAIFLVVFAISRIRALRIRKRANRLLEAQREKLHKTNLRLEEEKRAADHANKAKSEFLATMTHELRTPLNAVLGLTEIIDRINREPNIEPLLENLKFSGDNLLNIINNILDYKSFERGIIEIKTGEVNLKELHDKLLKSTTALVGGRNIRVTGVYHPTAPPFVAADKLRLTQIFNNLLGNSVKFTKEGFVDFSISAEQIDSERYVFKFSVSDSGVGIHDSVKGSIFESFVRINQTSGTDWGGTGLGLSIVKMLTEMMNGKIKLESTPGSGAQFTIEIPLYLPLPENRHVNHKPDDHIKQKASDSDSSLRILVVDDNEINLFVAAKLIEQEGMTAVTCDSGFKAIELCQQQTFSLVLMDLQMPGMDGIEAAQIILKAKPEMPIIALTAGEKDEFYMQNHGDSVFAEFLRKPFETKVLMDIIRRKSDTESL